MTYTFNFIRPTTLSIYKGDFTSFEFMVRRMVKEYPELQRTIDNPTDISRHITAMDYWLNSLLPHMEQGATEQDCREWIVLARTRIIGPY